VIHVYAIAEGLRELPDENGIDDTPLIRHAHGGLDFVASEHDSQVELDETAVLAHARVVEGLMPLADAVLPARFGLAFEDTAALETAVDDRAEALRDSLAQVRGCVELGIRVVGEENASPPAADTGREYLEARRAQLSAGDELHAELTSHARAGTAGRPGGKLVLSAAYLVDPASIPEFQRAVGALEADHPELTFALTGPWPPYSFAGVEA
jgi:hypothetical protein